MKIIVLLGGESAERRVSLLSGETVARALADRGHEVYKVDLIDPVRIVPARVALFREAVGEKPPVLSDLPRFTPRRLAALIGMAADEAVMRGEELAIHFTDDSYAFMVLKAGEWQPARDDHLLKTYKLPAGLKLRLEVEGEAPLLVQPDDEDEDDKERRVPQVYILSSGEMTPFTATLQAHDSTTRYRLSASVLGRLEWEAEPAW